MIDESPESAASNRPIVLVLVGALPFLVLAAVHWHYGPIAEFGDWAQYLLHADALLHGRPYGDIGYIFTARNPFISPPVQPPGLPIALVPLLLITGGARESPVYKLFMIACVLAFLAAIGVYFSRHGRRTLAVATMLIIGLWLEVGFATNAVQPDAGFCAIVWTIFWLVDRPGAWTWRRATAVTMLGLAALAFRLAALPLLPAMGLYAVLHRRDAGAQSSARVWTPLAAWCATGMVVAVAVPGTLTFARLVPRAPGAFVQGVIESARAYPFAALEPFLYPLPWNHANDAYHLVAAVLAVVGAIRWLPRSRFYMSVLFAVCYLAMLLVLPMRDTRYLMPLAPLAVYLALEGASATVQAAGRLTRRATAPRRADGVALAAAVIIVAATLVQQIGRPAPVVLMDTPGVRSLFARLRAARDSGDVRAVFVNPRVLTWRTGVPAMGVFIASPDSTVAEFQSHRITHVVVGDFGSDVVRAASVRTAVQARPDVFRQLYSEGRFTVFALDTVRAPRP